MEEISRVTEKTVMPHENQLVKENSKAKITQGIQAAKSGEATHQANIHKDAYIIEN